jgi:uncharacterized membrane protein YbhN (UPF0104 family)
VAIQTTAEQGRRRGSRRISCRVACGLAVSAVVAVAAAVVLPAAVPNVLDATSRSPATPLIVAACWLVATSAAIMGKRVLAAGHLGWAGVTTAHITGTVANRIVPAGAGAAGLFLAALRRGGASTTAATGMIAAWAVAGGLAHAGGLVFGSAWLRGGWPALIVVTFVAAAMIVSGPTAVLQARRAGRAVARLRSPRARPRRAPSAVGLSMRARAARATAFARCVLEAARERPARAVVAFAAQTVAMLCLSIGFAAAATSFGLPVTAMGGMAAYVAGTALSSTAPTPAGIGSAEAALVGALVVAGATVSEALPTVLVFRAVILLAPIVAAAVIATAWLIWARRPRLAQHG